jgi:hypothetical protein
MANSALEVPEGKMEIVMRREISKIQLNPRKLIQEPEHMSRD